MTDKNLAIMNADIAKINDKLKSFTASRPELCEVLAQAMEYSLSAGGKRIRPLLVMAFYRLCGGTCDISEIASTIELVHTFSLIHDDLPCMDNDDFRRGKPSCHKQFGEAIALLAGDALSTLPFEIIADNAQNGVISSEIAVGLVKILASSIGIDGMIGGQVIDMLAESSPVNEQALRALQAKKTGALIKASCLMGCALAEADSEVCKASELYAENLGLAFQIRDDILDVTGTFEELGKPIGSDAEQKKATFVTLLGVEKSEALVRELTDNAIGAVSKYDSGDFLTELAESLCSRRN